MITPDEDDYLAGLYRAIEDAPLEPDAPQYVPLYSRADLGMFDPVASLSKVIRWSRTDSVQLFSGFRGTGKSTELLRLRDDLQHRGFVVLRADFKSYLSTSVAVDISDFLLFVAGAFGDELLREKVLDETQLQGGYWARVVDLWKRLNLRDLELNAKLTPEVGGAKLGEAGAKFKLELKDSSGFRERVQRELKDHLGALVADLRAWVAWCLGEVRRARGANTRVVLLIDSVEHVRGTFLTAADVQASLEALFVTQADHLRLPGVHVVYTVPPWLRVRFANLGALYNGLETLTALKLAERKDGREFAPGIEALKAIAAQRGDWLPLLGTPERLVALIRKSGGYPRGLLQLLRNVITGARSLPVSDHDFQRAIAKMKNDMLPIADNDARWMVNILQTQRPSLTEVTRLPELARFLDTNQVLAYRNGEEWYDVHPVIADEVVAQVTELKKRG